MDSEEETLYDDVDSGNESSGDDVDFAMEIESGNPRERAADIDEYPFEVLSTEEIVQHMVDSIKEVNTVVEVSVTPSMRRSIWDGPLASSHRNVFCLLIYRYQRQPRVFY